MYCLEAMTRDPERVADGRVDRQKSLRLPGRLEVAHVAFPPSAVLAGHLGPVVLVPSGSMGCRQPGGSAGGRIASQLVRDQLLWRSTLPLRELAEEALGGSRVPTARHQDVQGVAVLVHRSPEVVAFPADPYEHLIQVSDIAWPALSAPQVVRRHAAELATPRADCLVGDGDPRSASRSLTSRKLKVNR